MIESCLRIEDIKRLEDENEALRKENEELKERMSGWGRWTEVRSGLEKRIEDLERGKMELESRNQELKQEMELLKNERDRALLERGEMAKDLDRGTLNVIADLKQYRRDAEKVIECFLKFEKENWVDREEAIVKRKDVQEDCKHLMESNGKLREENKELNNVIEHLKTEKAQLWTELEDVKIKICSSLSPDCVLVKGLREKLAVAEKESGVFRSMVSRIIDITTEEDE